jgi:hypothetical protein
MMLTVKVAKPVVVEALEHLPDIIQEYLLDYVSICVCKRPYYHIKEKRGYLTMGIFGIDQSDKPCIEIYTDRIKSIRKLIFVTYHEVAHCWAAHINMHVTEKMADQQSNYWLTKYYPSL